MYIVLTYWNQFLGIIFHFRAFRKWWRSQPKHRSESMTETLKRNIWKIVGAFGCLCGLGSIYYSSHVELTPITNRKRFLALNYKQLSDIIEVECEQVFFFFLSYCVLFIITIGMKDTEGPEIYLCTLKYKKQDRVFNEKHISYH